MSGAGKPYKVLLTMGAQEDIESIYDYIARVDSRKNADLVLDQLLDAASTRARFPDKGSYPKELIALGIREYRQTAFKSYRLIYRVMQDSVVVYLIADGRRDMQSLLARRLLSSTR